MADKRNIAEKQKARVIKKPHKKWTHAETKRILDYLKDCIHRNVDIEKPTAAIFYRKMISREKMSDDINTDLLKNKVRNLKDQYFKARSWKNEAMKGDSMEGININEYIFRICPFYESLDVIYGSKNYKKKKFNDDSESDNSNNSLFEEIKIETEMEQIEDVFPQDADPFIIPDQSENPKSKIAEESKEIKISERRNSLKHFLSALQETHYLRLERDKAKIEVEEKRIQLENDFKIQELNLQREHFTFKKEKFRLNREMEERLKIKEMEKDERLARYELELKYKK